MGSYACAPSDSAINGSRCQSFSATGSVPSSQKHNSISGPLFRNKRSNGGEQVSQLFPSQQARRRSRTFGIGFRGRTGAGAGVSISPPFSPHSPCVVEVYHQDDGILAGAASAHDEDLIQERTEAGANRQVS